MKEVNLTQVKQAVQKLHSSELVGLDSKDFAYLDKLSSKEAFEDGYSFALRDVLIALNALAFPVPKKASITVTEDAFSITENGETTYCEILRNKDGSAWGMYPQKRSLSDDGGNMVDWRGARNILILSSMGRIKLSDFPDQSKPKKEVK